MKILHVVGARPNFIKMAPVFNALKKYHVRQMLVHTGQHYDANMSDIFFKQLNIKKPDVNLHVGSGSQAAQVANIMTAFEPVILKSKPNLVLIYGDVNSTLAVSLVCAKLLIPVGHVEAGLRSGDLTMPEEINRLVADRLSTFFFTTSPEAEGNLIREGINKKNIFFVGNTMIDTLHSFLGIIKNRAGNLSPFSNFGVVTIHRPSNVDNLKQLKKIVTALNKIAEKIPLIFPVHPRTAAQLNKIKGVVFNKKNIQLMEPLGYLEFLRLVYSAQVLITDSGGIQEETTFLKVPCLTLRHNTERPVTVAEGSNILIGDDFDLLEKNINSILNKKYKSGRIPALWDGKAAERIAKIIINLNI